MGLFPNQEVCLLPYHKQLKEAEKHVYNIILTPSIN